MRVRVRVYYTVCMWENSGMQFFFSKVKRGQGEQLQAATSGL